MPTPAPGLYARVTTTDIQLASAYLPLLIEVARQKRRISYGNLVDLAKARYPDSPIVQKAIPVSTGRRLDVVRMFTGERALPDLTSLVINENSGECGVGFTHSFDPVRTRETVFAFDWDQVTGDFAGFATLAEAAIKPRKKRRENEALTAMSDYYTANKATLPASIREHREQLVELLMDGFSPEEAFEQVLAPTRRGA